MPDDPRKTRRVRFVRFVLRLPHAPGEVPADSPWKLCPADLGRREGRVFPPCQSAALAECLAAQEGGVKYKEKRA